MKNPKVTLRFWILIAPVSLILFALSAQPRRAGLIWSG
jgi:hypothetical protein